MFSCCVYVFVWFSEQTAVFLPNSSNLLVLDRDSVCFRCSRNSVFKYWSDEIYALKNKKQ